MEKKSVSFLCQPRTTAKVVFSIDITRVSFVSRKSKSPAIFYSSVQMDDLEIQQHYDEFFEEIYVEMEKVNSQCDFLIFEQ